MLVSQWFSKWNWFNLKISICLLLNLTINYKIFSPRPSWVFILLISYQYMLNLETKYASMNYFDSYNSLNTVVYFGKRQPLYYRWLQGRIQFMWRSWLSPSVKFNRIGSVMVSVLASVELGSTPGRVKPKTKIGICCFSAKHATLSRKSKFWLARNQNNVSEWSDISNRVSVS